jgi:hypothetical protein
MEEWRVSHNLSNPHDLESVCQVHALIKLLILLAEQCALVPSKEEVERKMKLFRHISVCYDNGLLT